MGIAVDVLAIKGRPLGHPERRNLFDQAAQLRDQEPISNQHAGLKHRVWIVMGANKTAISSVPTPRLKPICSSKPLLGVGTSVVSALVGSILVARGSIARKGKHDTAGLGQQERQRIGKRSDDTFGNRQQQRLDVGQHRLREGDGEPELSNKAADGCLNLGG